ADALDGLLEPRVRVAELRRLEEKPALVVAEILPELVVLREERLVAVGMRVVRAVGHLDPAHGRAVRLAVEVATPFAPAVRRVDGERDRRDERGRERGDDARPR